MIGETVSLFGMPMSVMFIAKIVTGGHMVWVPYVVVLCYNSPPEA